MNVLLVGLGGAIGSIGRYLMGAWFQGLVGNPSFPWGTFLVNVIGAFLIGVAFGLSKDGPLPSQAWTLVVIGALGGYTTFSTFALDNTLDVVDKLLTRYRVINRISSRRRNPALRGM